jgi:hypothetical protein
MAGVDEDNEEFPGNYILYNKDDDDGDGIPDYDDGYNKNGIEGDDDDENIYENDLVSITLCGVEPYNYMTGQVTFDVTSGASKVKVWENSTKGTEVSLPATFNTPVGKAFYVEGIEPSDGPRDVTIKLMYTKEGLPFEDKIKVTVVHVELFRDSAYTQPLDDWPKSGNLLRSPRYIFGEDDPIYVQVKNIGTDPSNIENKSSAVAVKSQSSSKYIYLTLQETGVDTEIFRNSEALGELLYLSTSSSQGDGDKIKVVDEEVLNFWLLMPPGSTSYKRSIDVMVDRGEVAAVDGTPTLDAGEFHNDMLSNYDWFSNGLYDKNHDRELGDDDKCVELGSNVDFMYIAGHCIRADSPTRIYAVDNTYGLKTHGSSDNLQVADVGTWARELDWLVLACCSTLYIDYDTKTGPGTEWVGTMDNGGLMHGIMGYQYGSPGGTTPTTDVQIADEFVSALGTKTVKDAWIDTNFGHKWATSDWIDSPLNAVAIFRNVNVSDQLGPISTQYIYRDIAEDNFTYYEIYWEHHNYPPYVIESSVRKDCWGYVPP